MAKRVEKSMGVEAYFLLAARQLEAEGRLATAENYRNTMHSFLRFIGPGPVSMSEITGDTVRDYDNYLSGRGLVRNTISFYNRVLRAVYHKAVRDGLASATPDPFSASYTGVDRTRKRALDVAVLRQIMDLDLSGETEMALSRDLFLFSFYTRGMCFVDMAYLTWQNVRSGAISYVRSKTGQRLNVQLEPCMTEIMERWKDASYGDYVFPIVKSSDPREAFKDYSYGLRRHDLLLKEIGRRSGSCFPLSSYAARHSWATLARNAEVPVSVISSGMGHTSERTTRIYLAELDNTIVDRANRRIIGLVRDNLG